MGLATDDPINADAHIDLRKRVWKYYSQTLSEKALKEVEGPPSA